MGGSLKEFREPRDCLLLFPMMLALGLSAPEDFEDSMFVATDTVNVEVDAAWR